jgi:hypothetical protein
VKAFLHTIDGQPMFCVKGKFYWPDKPSRNKNRLARSMKQIEAERRTDRGRRLKQGQAGQPLPTYGVIAIDIGAPSEQRRQIVALEGKLELAAKSAAKALEQSERLADKDRKLLLDRVAILSGGLTELAALLRQRKAGERVEAHELAEQLEHILGRSAP